MSKDNLLLHGDQIPGSRFFRAFCHRCKEPMRVPYSTIQIGKPVWCEECEPRRLANVAATKDETDPWGENAVRALEDRYD